MKSGRRVRVGDMGLSKPITGIACCARAASGHAAAPTSSVMNSRRCSFDHLVGAGEHIGGTSRPSALAVLRLMTSSNLVGSCTGSSPGLAPRRMRST